MGVDEWIYCGDECMIKVDNIKLKVGHTDVDVKKAVAKALKIDMSDIQSVEFLRLSIDARKKPNVFYVASVGAVLKPDLEKMFASQKIIVDRSPKSYQKISSDIRPVVVGFGPAGMFAALMLARMGLRPIVIEQGKRVDEREQDVQKFWQDGKLNEFSNVQFGEGGAGTFSDGKLNTNAHNEYVSVVLNEFYNHGAPKEILYRSKPHIGSDNLKNIVKSIREEILSLGGEILFSTKLTGLSVKNGVLSGINLLDINSGRRSQICTQKLVLAVGHSAKDVFEILKEVGANLRQKPFAMGVRIEQKQEDINIAQYGERYDRRLPNADYKLVTHLENGRSVFTFCMCPGGVVVCSSSDERTIVTNGMSYFARDKENANSALLVTVMPSDFGDDDALAGVRFQQKYERLAFELGGHNYSAPAQSVGEFLGHKTGLTLTPSYRPNVKVCDIGKCLPDFVTQSLRLALPRLNQKLKNFARDENMLIAIESRSSCPLTIVRDETYQSNIRGIFPVGEGAGYAGGIMTSAIDGVKCAEAIYDQIKNCK